MAPFTHRFQVPVALIPTVQPFCSGIVSWARVALTNFASNVEILYHVQIGQNLYTEYGPINENRIRIVRASE